MKYIIILLTLAVSGCYQTVNENDIQTAIKACGSLDNVTEITADFMGGESVTCGNREYIRLDNSVWNKK